MNQMFKNSAGEDINEGRMEQLRADGWPVDFDFETDAVCQNIFLPYIKEQLKKLEEYDNKRNHLSDYRFHIHAVDAANDVKNTALELGLGQRVANNMYYATLIHDIGKMDLPPKIWDLPGTPTKEQKQQKREHVEKGCEKFLEHFKNINHPFKTLAHDIMRHHHEAMDGSGRFGIKGQDLSKPARLAAIVEHYDGQSHPRPHQIERGDKFDPPSIFERIDDKNEGHFDPDLYQAFKRIKLDEYQRQCTIEAPEHNSGPA